MTNILCAEFGNDFFVLMLVIFVGNNFDNDFGNNFGNMFFCDDCGNDLGNNIGDISGNNVC